MHKRIVVTILCLLFSAAALSALDSDGRSALKLVPAPKEVQLGDGGFHVGPRTRIFVQLGHQSEDRLAAETLAEEVADHSGLKLDIVGAKSVRKSDGSAIVLARLDNPRVRRFLARKGLKADQVVGDQGYLLFSDSSKVVVAANSGEGLFYGVQTLRQLLRPMGKDLVCPAVAIRDWPGLDWTKLEKPGVQDDRSRQAAPELLTKQYRRPQA
jgi:hexosaminidase